jgi:hypothetical protein
MPFVIEKLPPEYAGVGSLEVGQVTSFKKRPEGAPEVGTKYFIVQLTGKFPEGPQSYDVMRERLRAGLASQSGQENYLKQLRSQVYIDIREP